MKLDIKKYYKGNEKLVNISLLFLVIGIAFATQIDVIHNYPVYLQILISIYYLPAFFLGLIFILLKLYASNFINMNLQMIIAIIICYPYWYLISFFIVKFYEKYFSDSK